MTSKKLGCLLFLYLFATSTYAVVLNLNTADLQGINSGWADRANDFTLFGGALPKGCGLGQCYEESGFYVGTAAADSGVVPNVGAHLHPQDNQNTGTIGYGYENDSVGIVLKAVNSSNFNFNSIDLDLSQSADNTYNGDFVIASYTINADGSRGTLIGSINIPNFSQDGVLDLSLNGIFQDIGMIYMYYDPFTLENTDGTNINARFFANIDNIDVTAVPIPAAVYLFGTGLLGLFSLKRKSTLNSAA